jgi:ubiquinone/menaquinone biosynthesis C-methylase UbiE
LNEMSISTSTGRTGHSTGHLLPLLFRSEQSYGWSIGMRHISRTLLADPALPLGPVVDLGCGGGAMATELAKQFPDRRVYGLDLHPSAVQQASAMFSGLAIQTDINHLPLPSASVALLLALDSLDQAGVDPAQSLGECRRVLKRNGLLIARVSAHGWLEGPHDAAFNTSNRQRRSDLVALLRAQGFRPMRHTYANMLLAPPVIAVRLLQRRGLMPMFETMARHTALDDLMETALATESRWLCRHNLPFGLSLFLLARK